MTNFEILATICAMAVLAPDTNAQEPYRRIRFTTADSTGVHHWDGFLERVTRDSVYVRFRDADSISAFSRADIGSVERQRDIHRLRAVGIGCLAVGASLGALGYFRGHDPDSPGLDKIAGVLGFGVGCVAGGVGGLLVSATPRSEWEPWTLPESTALERPRDAEGRVVGGSRRQAVGWGTTLPLARPAGGAPVWSMNSAGAPHATRRPRTNSARTRPDVHARVLRVTGLQGGLPR